jgi:ankyrin repeat protein
MYAVNEKSPACVKILREAGADVEVSNRNKESPYSLVGESESTVLLLKFSKKIETRDANKLLHLASTEGWPDVADLLVKGGADVNA